MVNLLKEIEAEKENVILQDLTPPCPLDLLKIIVNL